MSAQIILLNGNTEVRTRASESVTFLEDDKGVRCGCAHTATHWLQMCDAHHSEDNRLHLESLARLDLERMAEVV